MYGMALESSIQRTNFLKNELCMLKAPCLKYIWRILLKIEIILEENSDFQVIKENIYLSNDPDLTMELYC